jgi:hypothetical protein
VEGKNHMKTALDKLIIDIEQAKTQQELDLLLNQLVNLGKPAVKGLLEKMPGLVTSRLRIIGAKFFYRIGYPNNEDAIPFIVSDASDINSITYEESYNTILQIGKHALSQIEEAIDWYSRECEVDNTAIESLEGLKQKILQNK